MPFVCESFLFCVTLHKFYDGGSILEPVGVMPATGFADCNQSAAVFAVILFKQSTVFCVGNNRIAVAVNKDYGNIILKQNMHFVDWVFTVADEVGH